MEFVEEKKIFSFGTMLMAIFIAMICLVIAFGMIIMFVPQYKVSLTMSMAITSLTVYLLIEMIRPKASSVILTDNGMLIHISRGKIEMAVEVTDIEKVYYNLGTKKNHDFYLPIVVIEDEEGNNYIMKTYGFEVSELLYSLEDMREEIEFIEADLSEYV